MQKSGNASSIFSSGSIMPFTTSKRIAALEANSHFNAKELTTLFKQFQRISKNGSMDTEAFRQSLGILGMVQDSLLCQRLFKVFNSSKSGLIDFQEYVAGLSVLVKGTVDEKLDFAFRMADVDGSGQLTFEELLQMVQSIVQIYTDVMGEEYAAATLDTEKVLRMFKRMDKDHDGLVSMEEYVRGMKRHPEFVASLRGSDMFHSSASQNLLDSQEKLEHYEKLIHKLKGQVNNAVELVNMLKTEQDCIQGNSSIGVTREQDVDDRTITDSEDSSSSSSESEEKLESSTSSLDSTKQDKSVNFSRDAMKHDVSKQSNRLRSDFPALSTIDELSTVLRSVQGKLNTPLPGSFTPKFPAETPLARTRIGNSSVTSPILQVLGSAFTFPESSYVSTERSETQKPNVTESKGAAPQEETNQGAVSAEPMTQERSTMTRPTIDTKCSTLEAKEVTVEVTQEEKVQGRRKEASKGSRTSDASRDRGRSSVNSRFEPFTPRNLDDSALAKFLRPSGKAGGSTVFFGHKNWDLVLNVMKGIQIATGRSGAETTRPIGAFDFTVKEKYTLVSGARFRDESVLHSSESHLGGVDETGRWCRFVDYAPLVFNRLRSHFGISTKDYIHSIGPGNMLSDLMLGTLSTLSEVGSEGKSGSFFYFTSDGKFLVKTVHREEHKLLRQILPKYYHHMVSPGDQDSANDHGNNSLLCRIVGCHILRLGKHNKLGGKKIYLVVMTNMLSELPKELEIHRRYDLKGSWVGRKAGTNGKGTMKDVDFVNNKEKIRLDPESRELFISTIKRDAAFLASQNLIDYSLLLGVHSNVQNEGNREGSPENSSNVKRMDSKCSSTSSPLAKQKPRSGSLDRVPFFQRDNGGLTSSDGKETYVMGIIDFLTPYTTRKRCERLGKVALFQNPRGISVSPPAKYSHRFTSFLESHCE